MKKIILLSTVMVLVILSALQAQPKKGQWTIGGNVHFSTSKNTDNQYDMEGVHIDKMISKMNEFRISPSFGYSLSDRWMIGLELGYSVSKKEDNRSRFNNGSNVLETDSLSYEQRRKHNFSVAPYARYFIPISKRVSFALIGTFAFGFGNEKKDYYDMGDSRHYEKRTDKYDISSIDLSIRPEFWFHITDRLSLTGSTGVLNYNINKFNGYGNDAKGDEQKTKSFTAMWDGVSFGMNFSF